MLREILQSIKEIIVDYVKSRLFPVTVVVLVLFSILVHQLFVLQPSPRFSPFCPFSPGKTGVKSALPAVSEKQSVPVRSRPPPSYDFR